MQNFINLNMCQVRRPISCTQARGLIKRGLHHFGQLPLMQAVYLLLLCYRSKKPVSESGVLHMQAENSSTLNAECFVLY